MIARPRRFLAVKPGAYPAPVPPRPLSAPGVEAKTFLPPPLETGPELEPTGNTSPVVRLFDQSSPGPIAAEPDLDALLTGPASPAFAPLPEQRAYHPAPHEEEAGQAPEFSAGMLSAGGRPSWGVKRLLVGGIVGLVLGLVAGLVMLALAQTKGDLSALTNPLALWQSVDDTRMKLTAILVAAAFALLGAAVAARSAKKPADL